MAVQDFDAIVVGASFAGLAVARQLRGEVLLLDRHEVGAVQTSACGTPLWVPRTLGVEGSVLQVHERLSVRTPAGTVTYDLSRVPFCTFDYGAFCRGLLAQCRARFLRAPVTGARDGGVLTPGGAFRAPIIVDASGWRGAVVNGGRPPEPGRGACSFGLEAHTGVRGEGLAFRVDGRLLRRGLGWIFPVGAGSLVGLGSYAGSSRLGPALGRLLAELGTAARGYHGGFFPSRLLRPTVGRVFAVGDAAGQCLPLTAEGIRPAVVFGTACGRLVQRVLDGRLALGEALARYAQLVEGYRWAYRVLGAAQWVAAHAPARWLGLLAGLAGREPFLSRWWPRYGRFGLRPPAPEPLGA